MEHQRDGQFESAYLLTDPRTHDGDRRCRGTHFEAGQAWITKAELTLVVGYSRPALRPHFDRCEIIHDDLVTAPKEI